MATFKTKCGVDFEVDDDVASEISGFAWKIDWHGYVMRKTTIDGRHGRNVLLHRYVMRCNNPSVIIDHKNTNKMDNRKSNLRQATCQQNSFNRLKEQGRLSQFKGVTWHKKCGKWQCSIGHNGKLKYLGLFEDEHEAGHAYNRAAIELHGEFARLNPVGRK